MPVAVAVAVAISRRDALLKTSQRHKRKIVRIEVVAQVKMIGESRAGKFALVPRARVVLTLQQPCDAPPDVIADVIFTREQAHDRPRGLRGRAGAAPAP